MAFYNSPEEMYKARASRFKKMVIYTGQRQKNGDGDYHYGKAKKCYNEAKINEEKAKKAKGLSFKRKSKAGRG